MRRRTRATLARHDHTQQLLRLFDRVREARSVLQPEWRRALRDDHAMQVVMASLLRPESNVIDVGACEGAILASAVRLAPGGRHIAYEPIPELHERLAARFRDQDVRQVALSDVTGTAQFTHVLDRPTFSGLRQRTDTRRSAMRSRQIAVRTERLDDAVDERYVPTLVKIDVEGAELQVLRGAMQTLERHRPLVVFEHGAGGAELYDARPTDIFDLLEGVGMRIFDLEGEGPYSRAGFEATFEQPIWNFLATPA